MGLFSKKMPEIGAKNNRVLESLIDAESRGSVLASKLKQQLVDYDESKRRQITRE